MRVSGSAVQDTGGESEIHSAVTGEGGGWGDQPIGSRKLNCLQSGGSCV